MYIQGRRETETEREKQCTIDDYDDQKKYESGCTLRREERIMNDEESPKGLQDCI